MKVLSLFDGISCGQIALKKSGINCEEYFASEIDKNAIKIALKNFPNTIQLGDVSSIQAKELPKIDLLIGGSPCQSFSQTISNNTGFDGKSKLFFEYLRLLKEINPKYFLLENVVMKKEWENIITGYLNVEPKHINSENFSAQSRPRVYWTNIPIKEIPKNISVLEDILEKEVEDKYYYKEPFVYHGMDKVVCATLMIKGHDILKRVNSPKHKCQTLTAVCGGNQQKKVLTSESGRVRKLTPKEYERLQTVPDDYTTIVSDSARYKALGNGWTVDVIAHIFKGIT